MVKKIGEKLPNTDLEKSTEAWVEFMNIKQGDDEDAKAYVTRFEQAETKLRNVKIKVPNKALAIHLMNKSNLEEQSKENVLTKVELDDETKLYSSMMKSIREMKCNLTKNKEKTVSDKDENRTYYGNRNNYDYHTRARSKSKFNDRSGRQRSKSWSKFRDNRERRDDRENRDTRERRDDRGNRDFQGRTNDRGRRSSRDSWRNRSRSISRNESWRNKGNSDGRPKKSTSEEVNFMHYSQYNLDEYTNNFELINDIETDLTHDTIEKDIVRIVYEEGFNSDIDPYKLVVDCGCPKTVCGRPWIDAFVESKGDNFMIKREKENQNFKFGPSDVYSSEHNYAVEVNIGKLSEVIKVSVVEANIPLLLGLDYQEKWGMVIDIGKKNIHIRKTGENFKIKGSRSKHWTLPIQKKTLHSQVMNLIFNV